MKFKKGTLYCLSNELWGNNIYKIGNTGQTLKSRISTIQTSLYLDCNIVNQSDNLTCCIFWENVLENILSPYRINPKREFYCISEEEIKFIFVSINELNKVLDSEEKILKYIEKFYPEYFSKKIKCEFHQKKKLKKIKGIFVDTSY